MKYFKPDLLARCRSLDDQVAEAAAQEWEQAITDYRARIKAIRLRLPTGARRLLGAHHAGIYCAAQQHQKSR